MPGSAISAGIRMVVLDSGAAHRTLDIVGGAQRRQSEEQGFRTDGARRCANAQLPRRPAEGSAVARRPQCVRHFPREQKELLKPGCASSGDHRTPVTPKEIAQKLAELLQQWKGGSAKRIDKKAVRTHSWHNQGPASC